MYVGIYTYILSNFVFFGAIPHQFERIFLISWENHRDCHITMPLSLKTMEVQIKGDQGNKRFRDCAIITWGGWETGEICPPHIMMTLRLTPLPPPPS